MRLAVLLAFVTVAWACDRAPDSRASTASPTPPAASASATESSGPQFPLRVDGSRFIDSASRPFTWSGISAFRLAEMIARGREAEAAAYLDWAASEELTVVRVLAMAKHLFALSPEDGRNALPRLLDLARARGLAVEIVALADTREYAFDHDQHLREIGRIALDKNNAFVEIANEPGHPTQHSRLHDPAELLRLAALVPPPVVTALGSAEYAPGYADGDYATFHFARGGGWGHVLRLAEGASFIAQWKKPVINDEPIGAAAEYHAGRRDNDPARFAAAGALTALTGMSGTFHYEGGLQAKVPEGREAACLAAWQLGAALVGDASPDGEFLEGKAIGRLAHVTGIRAAFARVGRGSATILLVDPQQPTLEWRSGWTEDRRAGVPGALIVRATRP